jgi:hypothetical protein
VNITAENFKARGRSYDKICKGYVVNPLNRIGNYVYHLLLTLKSLNFAIECICGLHMIFRINRDYFLIEH